MNEVEEASKHEQNPEADGATGGVEGKQLMEEEATGYHSYVSTVIKGARPRYFR